jgi:hypothetical protein
LHCSSSLSSSSSSSSHFLLVAPCDFLSFILYTLLHSTCVCASCRHLSWYSRRPFRPGPNIALCIRPLASTTPCSHFRSYTGRELILIIIVPLATTSRSTRHPRPVSL